MSSRIRPGLFALAAGLLVIGGIVVYLAPARADSGRGAEMKPTAQHLVTGNANAEQPKTMEEFLTAVTTDVDTYWTKQFKDSGLPEPKVTYAWIPAGASTSS